jgi:glutathione S-transferase
MVTADAAFDTVQIKLEQPDTQRRISEYSPSGKVPALLLDSVVINDSLAISEYIAEAYPDANLWPRDTRLRALARSAAAEMHSGFTHLRTQMAFGLALATMRCVDRRNQEEIDRIFSIWEGLLAASQSSAFLWPVRHRGRDVRARGVPLPPLWRQRAASTAKVCGSGCGLRAGSTVAEKSG